MVLVDIEETGKRDSCSACLHPCACSSTRAASAKQYDVLVLGAGVVGCAVARELARFELAVGVVDKYADVGQGASKANSGIVHGGYDAEHGSLKSELGHRGNQMFPQLQEELQFGFKQIGSLVLAFSDEDVVQLEYLLENGRRNGVQNLKIVDTAEIRAMEPNVSLAAKKALYCPDAGIVSPYEFAFALAENAVSNGVDFLLSHAVTRIRREHKEGAHPRFHVHTAKGMHIEARCVVNCAGLFADEVSRMAGAEQFRITPRKGDYIILNRRHGSMVRHVLFQAPTSKWGKGILVTPTVAGNLMLGPSAIDVTDKRDTSTSVEELAYVAWAARRTVPNLDLSKAITSYAGLRARPDNKDFTIAESALVPGFVNVAGIESPGLTSSPAIGERVSAIVRGLLVVDAGNNGVRRKANFNPRRRAVIMQKDEDFDGEIDHPDPAKNIICRCEKVTEAEIRDALSRGIHLTATDSIKWRTRAGMGQCQGEFCRPRVVDLIAKVNNMMPRDVSKRVHCDEVHRPSRYERVVRALLARL